MEQELSFCLSHSTLSGKRRHGKLTNNAKTNNQDMDMYLFA